MQQVSAEMTRINFSLARAYLGTNQTGVASVVYTKVLLGTENYDIGNNFSSYKYVCPVTGYYSVKASVYMVTVTGAVLSGLASIRKNGVDAAQGTYVASANGNTLIASVSSDLYCLAGEYLELFGYAATTGATTFSFGAGSDLTFMSVHLIST